PLGSYGNLPPCGTDCRTPPLLSPSSSHPAPAVLGSAHAHLIYIPACHRACTALWRPPYPDTTPAIHPLPFDSSLHKSCPADTATCPAHSPSAVHAILLS